MKKNSYRGIVAFIILVSISCWNGVIAQKNQKKTVTHTGALTNECTAVVITGAASRIPQETALLENLYRKGMLNDVCFISGASSGALNAVILNAILAGKYSFQRYKNILFSLGNDNIYLQNNKKLPLDTDPLKKLLSKIIIDTLHYRKIGDLPFPTAISATAFRLVPPLEKTLRFSNRLINPESNPQYNLVNILMASTAIPFVFPHVLIQDFIPTPNQYFIDGGVAEDHIPFEAVLQYSESQKVKIGKLYIISRKFDTADDVKAQIDQLELKDSKLIEKTGVFLHRHLKESFLKKLQELQKRDPDLASRTYIYVPDFKENFFLLDFNSMKKQYDVTSAWANKNNPLLLQDYLGQNKISKK